MMQVLVVSKPDLSPTLMNVRGLSSVVLFVLWMCMHAKKYVCV